VQRAARSYLVPTLLHTGSPALAARDPGATRGEAERGGGECAIPREREMHAAHPLRPFAHEWRLCPCGCGRPCGARAYNDERPRLEQSPCGCPSAVKGNPACLQRCCFAQMLLHANEAAPHAQKGGLTAARGGADRNATFSLRSIPRPACRHPRTRTCQPPAQLVAMLLLDALSDAA